MRVLLVTGGAGFIGANFVEYWLEAHPGDRVVVLDALTYAGNHDSLRSHEGRPNFKFMHGNIYEWCRDWYHLKLPGGVDPDLHDAESTTTPNRTGDHSRSRRGGAWTDDGWACRTGFRLRFEPERRYDHIGFRVVVVRL